MPRAFDLPITADNFYIGHDDPAAISSFTFEKLHEMYEQACEVGHKFFIHGIVPVTYNLFHLYREVLDARPTLRPVFQLVTGVSRGSFQWFHSKEKGVNYPLFGSIAIAHRDFPWMSLAAVGFGNFPTDSNKTDRYLYHITSPNIQNDQYRAFNNKYHMKLSKKIEPIVAATLAHAIPPAVPQLFEKLVTKAETALKSQIRDKKNDEFFRTFTVLNRTMYEEVQNMVKIGYVPVTEDFKNAMTVCVERGEDLRRGSSYAPRQCHVMVKAESLVYMFSDDPQPIEIYDIEQFPEHLANKLSLLQMLKDGEALIDSGIKHSKSSFTIFI